MATRNPDGTIEFPPEHVHPEYGAFECGCGHDECTTHLVREIDRVGLEAALADIICVVEEREADAQLAMREAEREDYYR